MLNEVVLEIFPVNLGISGLPIQPVACGSSELQLDVLHGCDLITSLEPYHCEIIIQPRSRLLGAIIFGCLSRQLELLWASGFSNLSGEARPPVEFVLIGLGRTSSRVIRP